MKRLIYAVSLIILVSFLFISCGDKYEFKGKFSYLPEKPQPGEKITILYNPDSTNLKDSKNIEMLAYSYSVDLDNTRSFDMRKEGKGWVGEIITDQDAKGLIIKFENIEDVIDNNDGEGYIINLYNNNGEILPGSLGGLAAAYASWGSYYVDMDLDRELALEKFNEEFEKNPDIKPDYLDSYFYTVTRVYPDKKDSIVKAGLSKIKDNPETEEELETLVNWYNKIEDTVQANKYKKVLAEKYPESDIIQVERYREIYNEPYIDKKIELVKNYEIEFPEGKYSSTAYDLILNSYVKKGDYKKAETFLMENPDKPSPYRLFSVTNSIIEKDGDLNIAYEFAKTGVERAKKEVENPSEEKPASQSEKEWKNSREYIYGLNLYALGNVLLKQDNTDKAVNNLKKAVELTEGDDPDINEAYSKALIENENYDDALSELEKFIKDGKSTSKMNDLLKTAYIKKNGSDEGFEAYNQEIQKSAKKNLTEEVKKQMINQPAPTFKLTDLEGNEVSLSDFKGEVVILDFWATWCGPCISSFPGMQQSVNNFSDDDNVNFLFVNTWENVDNKKENAENFIKKNNYNFHVLMDTENKVIEKYKVSGIPTKFIIDGNGNIRFKSVGFGGSTDQLVEELGTMINMVKES